MPELPEVQTVVTTLRPRLLGQTIRHVQLNRRDIVEPIEADLPALLAGRTFADIQRRGKRIVITLDDGNRFYIHLGMTGRLTIEKPSDPALPHTHLIVDFAVSQSVQLRFCDPRRFGGIWWLGNADADEGMGPEPLTLKTKTLADNLGRTTRAIKSALLDQSVVAGLGNIYVDESLFTAKIHPLTPANKLSGEQVTRLNRAIKSTLRKAINARGSTLRDYRDADGNAGDFQKLHRVYARDGQPCAVCRETIQRIVLGGRSTCFCPDCQKPAAAIAKTARRGKSSLTQKRPRRL
ncbi:MAG TPA: bifunctional DNA-formamidopyrimidine glycosylase/DNA-(apurinic or apyrimidinic site) lyase [Tepidisphaeraceae bacterium]|jgi:formamidopyrimidine-DNA glycosylase|nr:bifunctional DNA-formamidopyrimidine glycosylase/DNA-(apurinic or apyrimidinic site) lyase [Tepidisphaeraceae bacterium]